MPTTLPMAPTELKTKPGRECFLSYYDSQRQVFLFSKWKIKGITRHPRLSVNSKHQLWHFSDFWLQNIFFWLTAHKCPLLGLSVINHHILTIPDTNSSALSLRVGQSSSCSPPLKEKWLDILGFSKQKQRSIGNRRMSSLPRGMLVAQWKQRAAWNSGE